jgi:hypothetical protein
MHQEILLDMILKEGMIINGIMLDLEIYQKELFH